jgi:eukaryotic-like serine/threonine-protein kinase
MAVSKKKFPWIDIAIGALVTAVVLLVFHFQWADPMEYKLYDMRAKLRAQKPVSDTPIILVGINDESINTIGRWPWPRTYIADAVKQLSESGAKVIGVDVLFNDKELNPGLDEVRALKAAAAETPKFPAEFAALLDTTEKKLDNDAELENEMAFAQTCVLPMYFQVGQVIGRSTKPIPEAVEKNFLPKTEPAQGSELEAADFIAPYEPFAKVAKSIGHINLSPSSDGVQREVPLLVQYNNRVYPSLALQSLRAYYNLESEDYRYNGAEVVLGRAHIPVDGSGRMLVNYFGAPYKTFPTISFADLRNHKVQNMDAFRDKIVLIGMMATGGGDLQTTPVGDLYPGVELQANIIQSVLSNTYITRPPWATKAELGVLIFFGLFVSLAIPYLSAGRSAIIALVLLIATVGGGVYLFTAYGFWLKMLYPSMLLVAGYVAVISTRYFATQKHEQKLEGESAESNKMLGLSFQGQGMLDLAFDKFRRCPIDESMKECLYNLALDFERKRQFNKAVSVLDHIMTADKKYKDVATRASQLRVASETVILGKGTKAGAEGTVMLEHGPGVLAKPTLGRYEVLKELGKGAMGLVYLGKDPKINREVAIKTLRFEDEFEAADMAAMKERFFREAESAGRLVHPNIVTIYDAGDDGDISYIAMELLNGVDLKDFVKKDKLLPVNETLEDVAKVAEALNYAHSMGIVHRDIKPANIMRLKDGTIKVTDFGIARITSQSKTATGTVMGTPSYMAPEQLAGAKVDGRADLFSLGVTMYELLTGEKPFTGESVATLMYRIANEPHPPIRRHRIELPTDIEIILDRVLAKNPDERYQHGTELANDLRLVIKKAAAAGA